MLEYLEETFPGRPFLPSKPAARARDRQIMAFLRSDTLEMRRTMPFECDFGRGHSPGDTDGARADAARVVDLVRTRRNPEQPTLADLDLAIAVRRLIHHGYDLSGIPDVVAYSDTIWKRASLQSWGSLERPAP